MYLLIKYTKGFLWRVAKRLSYIEDARFLKVKHVTLHLQQQGNLSTGKHTVWSHLYVLNVTGVSNMTKIFEVLAAILLSFQVFQNVRWCCWGQSSGCFERSFYHLLHGRSVREEFAPTPVMMILRPSETSGTLNPTKQRNIAED